MLCPIELRTLEQRSLQTELPAGTATKRHGHQTAPRKQLPAAYSD